MIVISIRVRYDMARAHRIVATRLLGFKNTLELNQLVVESQPTTERCEDNDAPVFRSKMVHGTQECSQTDKTGNQLHHAAFIQLNCGIT